MPITALPTAPARSDPPATFVARADALIAALPTMVSEINIATNAMNLNATNDTSASSVAIGTGSKSFTVSSGKSFVGGMYLVIADAAAPSTNSMFGQVASYSGTSLVFNCISVLGSGTKTAWIISQSLPGTSGAQVVATLGANTYTGAQNMTAAGGTSVTEAQGDSSTKIATTQFATREARSRIQPIAASVASNALTITLNPTTLDFRSATLGSGTVNTRSVGAAISVVVSSGSTLGTTNAVASRLAVLAIDNAGTVELAVVNAAGGGNLDETTLITTVAEGGAGAADSISVIYSTTARSSAPFRVVGFVDSTQATAGTWATAPSEIQGVGGNLKLTGASGVRLNTANGYGSTNTVIRRFTNTGLNVGADITYADSATLGATFTVNTSGIYSISYCDSFTAASEMGISLNSTQLTTSIASITVADRLVHATNSASGVEGCASWAGYLSAGAVIRAHAAANATGANLAIFSMYKITS